VQEISSFNLNKSTDRFLLLLQTVNLFRILKVYMARIDQYKGPIFPYNRFVRVIRPGNIELFFYNNKVKKTITNLEERAPFCNQDHLKQIYTILNENHTLHHKLKNHNVIGCIKFDFHVLDGARAMDILLSPLCRPHKIDTFKQILKCLAHMANGLFFLHNKDILHRDLRWANVLYDHNKEAYLIHDFEHSAVVNSKNDHSLVDLKFRTNLPCDFMKMDKNKYVYNKSTDIFSFGQMIEDALDGSVDCTAKSSMLYIPKVSMLVLDGEQSTKAKVVELVDKMMNKSEEDRPTAKTTKQM
jgi:serine/threonine protein kinase